MVFAIPVFGHPFRVLWLKDSGAICLIWRPGKLVALARPVYCPSQSSGARRNGKFH